MASILTKGLFCLFILVSGLEAKDLGICGHVFRIEEEDLLEYLTNKTRALSKEEGEALKTKLQNHFITQIQNPKAIKGLKNADSYQVRYVDPTICADQDIRNKEGKIIVRKGACINPLEYAEHLDALLFFDASKPKQLEWTKK